MLVLRSGDPGAGYMLLDTPKLANNGVDPIRIALVQTKMLKNRGALVFTIHVVVPGTVSARA